MKLLRIPTRKILLAATALTIVFASVQTIDQGLVHRRSPTAESTYPRSTTSAVEAELSGYRKEGIRFTRSQEDALRRLLGRWETREDLKSNFSLSGGTVDIVALVRWAQGNDDPDALALSLLRPDLNEAAARLGIMIPDGEVLNVLVQTLAMRKSATIEGGGWIYVLRNVWVRRPDIRGRFTVNGRVAVRPLLEWAATVNKSDPDFGVLENGGLDFPVILNDLPNRQSP